MISTFYSLLYLSLTGVISCPIILIVAIHHIKKTLRFKFYEKYKIVVMAVCMALVLFVGALSAKMFVLCCKDYQYASNYLVFEERAEVIEFTAKRYSSDGIEGYTYFRPKFYLIDKDQYIVLHVADVELGKTYIIRYYPHTKICEVVEEVQ